MKRVNTQPDADREPLRILLVEDNAGDVRLTQEMLADGRIATALYVVTDGLAALDVLRGRGEYADAPRPHVVLLDLNLPRKGGDEVLRELRSDDEIAHLPVVVLTGTDVQSDFVESSVPDADAYLRKPIDPDEFVDTLRAFDSAWLSLEWASDPDRDESESEGEGGGEGEDE